MQRIRLGTRGSPLALNQAHRVRTELLSVRRDLEIEIVVIKTSGDWHPAQGEHPLPQDQGGKALYSKEIQAALLRGEIDAAVHSMKDMETRGPKELIIPCMLPRENPLDALVVRQDLKNIQNLSDLPQGCRVGTSSVRRAAFLKNIRPDLQITPLRGNVHTRLEKLDSGQVQAVILAVAGLNRLGLESRIAAFLLPHEILPSAGQGAIGVEIHRENQDIISYFSQINDPETVTCVTLERAILHRLDGSCQTPIGAYARFLDQYIALSLSVASLDGVCRFDHTDIIENPHHDQLDEIGYDCANALLKKIKPESFLSIFKVPKQEE